MSSGVSRAIGHAGVVIAGGLLSAINEIVKNGPATLWVRHKLYMEDINTLIALMV